MRALPVWWPKDAGSRPSTGDLAISSIADPDLHAGRRMATGEGHAAWPWIRQLRRGLLRPSGHGGQSGPREVGPQPLAQLRERPDWRPLRLWYRDLRRDAARETSQALAKELSNAGIELMDSTTHISEHLAPVDCSQVLKSMPTERQLSFALRWCNRSPTAMWAVPCGPRQRCPSRGAIEGTDAMIDRVSLGKGPILDPVQDQCGQPRPPR